MTGPRPLVYVADTHLTQDDPEAEAFVAFLRWASDWAGTICHLGDLFNVWFGERKFRLPHQDRVLAALGECARRGVAVKFVEGNRDFSVRRNCLGDPFHEVAVDAFVEVHAGRRILAAHGDEVNRSDRNYRVWKRVTRSGPVYGLFRLLPSAWGTGLGARLERRLAGTNLKYKSRFPEAECRAWATSMFEATCDTIVLGHFHEERRLDLDRGTVFVLPTWRGTRRYLVFDGEGRPRWDDFTG